MPAHERRTHARVHATFDVSLGSEAHYFSAPSADLSPGGIFVATYRALAPGAQLSVEFDLPASRVVAKGKVRWIREASDEQSPGYGIAFTEMSRFDRTLIESYCAKQAEAEAALDEDAGGTSLAG